MARGQKADSHAQLTINHVFPALMTSGAPQVTFARAAHFVRNRAFLEESRSSASSPSPSSPGQRGEARALPCGGAVSVGRSGRVHFRELASFEGNSAVRGGGLCNQGWAKFFRRSFFNENSATGGEADGGGAREACLLGP